MNRTVTTLALIAATAAASKAALAQPAQAPAQPVDSSEKPRGALSHINGVPVPVGDHNQYYYETPKTNLSANPLGWAFGFYGVSASVAVHDHVAIRGDVTYYDWGDINGTEVSIGAPIYFRRVYSGLFLEPGFMVRNMRDSDGDDTTIGPQALVGWHWMWDSGLNFAVAFGGGRELRSGKNDFEDEPFINGYMRFGYAF